MTLNVRMCEQPDDISCGPAVLQMLAGALLARDGRGDEGHTSLSIYQLREMMGTNARTGTTDVEMTRGLRAFGVTFGRAEPEEGARHRMDEMADWLREGNIAIIRGMRRGYRHWMLATGMEGDNFHVADPESGFGVLNSDEMEAVLAPRGWETWLVPASSLCRDLKMEAVGANPARQECALDLMTEVLAARVTEIGPDEIRECIAGEADWDLSQGIWDGDNLLGAYVLRDASIVEAMEMDEMEVPNEVREFDASLAGQRLCWGVALGVPDANQGMGLGRLLRTAPGELGFDRSFGFQYKTLGNLENWQRVRSDTLDIGDCWLTVGRVSPLGPANIAEDSTAHDAEYSAESASLPSPH